MTTDVKLLPCPFCGRDEHLQVEHLEGTVFHPAYRVSCDNCGKPVRECLAAQQQGGGK